MAALASAAGSSVFKAASVTDDLQIETLSQYVSTDKTLLLEGEVEVSKAPGEVLRLVVMLNGTQIAELNESQSKSFLTKFPDLFSEVQSTGVGASNKGLIAKYFSDFESVKNLGAWKEGATFDPGVEAAFSGALMLKARADVELIKNFGFFWAGGAIGYKGYIKGKLPNKLIGLASSKVTGLKTQYGGSSSLPVVARGIVAIPWVKLEIEYDGNYLPEYHWLQENDKIYWHNADYKFLKINEDNYKNSLSSKRKELNAELQYNLPDSVVTAADYDAYVNSLKAKTEGQIVNYYSVNGTSQTPRSPLTYTLTGKLGVFHAAVIYSSSYTTPLFRLYVDDLELFIGKWGMGVISSKNDEGATTFVPGMWVDVYEFNIKTTAKGVVKWSPAKLYFHKLDRSFLLGMKTIFRFDFAK